MAPRGGVNWCKQIMILNVYLIEFYRILLSVKAEAQVNIQSIDQNPS